MSWSGYIDLLGTRDAGKLSAQELLEHLYKFHAALSGHESEFDGDCYSFSDGAFFSCERIELFYPFLSKIRNQLFQDNAFFRCSYLPGELTVHKIDKKRKGKKIFVSYKFSGIAPEAYQAESNFKGVGCVVDVRKPRNDKLRHDLEQSTDNDIKDQMSKQINTLEKSFVEYKKRYLVDSFYVVSSGRRVTAIPSTDFKYSPFEISDKNDEITPDYLNQQPLVDCVISACYTAFARSSRISSYYISALATMVRCCDVSQADWDSKEESWQNTPYIFRHLMSDNSLRVLKDVPGYHFLLLLAFDHLYKSKKSNGITSSMENRVIQHLLRTPSCFRDLDNVPDFVISASARHQLIDLKLRDARNFQKRKKHRGSE